MMLYEVVSEFLLNKKVLHQVVFTGFHENQGVFQFQLECL